MIKFTDISLDLVEFNIREEDSDLPSILLKNKYRYLKKYENKKILSVNSIKFGKTLTLDISKMDYFNHLFSCLIGDRVLNGKKLKSYFNKPAHALRVEVLLKSKDGEYMTSQKSDISIESGKTTGGFSGEIESSFLKDGKIMWVDGINSLMLESLGVKIKLKDLNLIGVYYDESREKNPVLMIECLSKLKSAKILKTLDDERRKFISFKRPEEIIVISPKEISGSLKSVQRYLKKNLSK